jgi:hypothetical protein
MRGLLFGTLLLGGYYAGGFCEATELDAKFILVGKSEGMRVWGESPPLWFGYAHHRLRGAGYRTRRGA